MTSVIPQRSNYISVDGADEDISMYANWELHLNERSNWHIIPTHIFDILREFTAEREGNYGAIEPPEINEINEENDNEEIEQGEEIRQYMANNNEEVVNEIIKQVEEQIER